MYILYITYRHTHTHTHTHKAYKFTCIYTYNLYFNIPTDVHTLVVFQAAVTDAVITSSVGHDVSHVLIHLSWRCKQEAMVAYSPKHMCIFTSQPVCSRRFILILWVLYCRVLILNQAPARFLEIGFVCEHWYTSVHVCVRMCTHVCVCVCPPCYWGHK